jgi:N-acetylglucosaminyl-diphospho-decaprenol L-rhamnosyltransferase
MSRKLAIVIVNYNTLEDCSGCVESILKHGVVDAGAIAVVDNCSPDGSGRRLAAMLPDVNVVLSQRNGGYAAGVNLGVAAIDAEFYLVLNPDTRVEENTIPVALAQFEREPRLGVLGLHLLNSDGSHQDSARRFFSFLTILLRRSPLGKLKLMRPALDEHLMTNYWSGGVFEADWVTGAGFIVRKQAYDQIGGMDEGYFLYLEDTDLCKRIWRAGWKVEAIPSVKITHFLQRDSAKSLFGRANRTFLRSLVRYCRKYGMPLWGHGSRN